MPDGKSTSTGRVRRGARGLAVRLRRGDRVRGRHVILGSLIVGLLAGAPFAVAAGTGDPLLGGDRNPSANTSTSLTRETQIIGDIAQGKGGIAPNTGGYVTRQSNKSDSGGGAIYGCRATAGKEACVAANNLANGDAFRFQASANAATVGQIRYGLDLKTLVNKPPFVTNATGTVQNLSADKIDGKDSTDFYTKDDANKTFVTQGSSLFAVVAADGTLGTHRGASKAALAAGGPGSQTFLVTFGTADVSGCSYSATARGTTPVTISASPTTNDKSSVTVTEGVAPAEPFSLTVTC